MPKPHTELFISVDKDINLRLVQIEDAQTLFELVEANRSYLRQFLGWLDHNRSEKDSLAFIQHQREQYERSQALTLGIWYRGNLVGLVGLHGIDVLNRSASIGYWLDESHQSKGIMSRSVQALVQHAFQSLNLHRLEVRCAVENRKSQAIPHRLEFLEEGIAKDALWHYGEYFDAYQYSRINPKESNND